MIKNDWGGKIEKFARRLFFLELTLFVFLLVALFTPNIMNVAGVVGANNVTVRTTLNVGQVAPDILSIIVNGGNTISLSPNTTTNVTVYVVARDYNNESDIINISLRFFDNVNSSYTHASDNNNHYRNNGCTIDISYGDEYEINATCIVGLWYYANNATWNATINVTDNSTRTAVGSNTSTVNILLGIGLPDSIDYGTVNATEVSLEQVANVTNFGNTIFNLTLDGYARNRYDNFSMNCTRGNIQNISIWYEKYNLNVSNTSMLSLAQFESIYINLTSAPVTKTFNLLQRYNDTSPYLDDTNASYWRMYVPVGVAGTCSGNIVFGAVQATGS